MGKAKPLTTDREIIDIASKREQTISTLKTTESSKSRENSHEPRPAIPEDLETSYKAREETNSKIITQIRL